MIKGTVRKSGASSASHPLLASRAKAGPISARSGPSLGRGGSKTAGKRSKGHSSKTAKESKMDTALKPPSEKARREKLLGDIESMLDVLTEDGLSHVLAIATMCRYELALVRSEASREKESLPRLEGEELRIERSADGATYHLISGKVWKILAAEDIASLLRITRHEEDESVACKRIYHWMKAERKDIAHDLGIHGESSVLLKEFHCILARTFPVRSPRRLP